MAPPPPGTQPNPTGQVVQMVGVMVIFGLMFYFMLIRPQRAKTKQLEGMLKALKARDKVLTNSGIVGIVVNVSDKTVTIRSAEAKLEILKSAIAEVMERASGEPTETKS